MRVALTSSHSARDMGRPRPVMCLSTTEAWQDGHFIRVSRVHMTSHGIPVYNQTCHTGLECSRRAFAGFSPVELDSRISRRVSRGSLRSPPSISLLWNDHAITWRMV